MDMKVHKCRDSNYVCTVRHRQTKRGSLNLRAKILLFFDMCKKTTENSTKKYKRIANGRIVYNKGAL